MKTVAKVPYNSISQLESYIFEYLIEEYIQRVNLAGFYIIAYLPAYAAFSCCLFEQSVCQGLVFF